MYQYFFKILIPILLDKYPEVRLLDHMVVHMASEMVKFIEAKSRTGAGKGRTWKVQIDGYKVSIKEKDEVTKIYSTILSPNSTIMSCSYQNKIKIFKKKGFDN